MSLCTGPFVYLRLCSRLACEHSCTSRTSFRGGGTAPLPPPSLATYMRAFPYFARIVAGCPDGRMAGWLVEGWVAGWFPDPSPLRRRIPAGRCGTPQIGPFGVPMRERLREAVLRCPPRRRTSPRGRGGAGKPPLATPHRIPRQHTAPAASAIERT